MKVARGGRKRMNGVQRGSRIVLLGVAAVLAMAALITAQQSIIIPGMTREDLRIVFVNSAIDWGGWALLVPLIVLLARRAPMFVRGRPRPAILLHMVVGIAATAIWTVPVAAITVVQSMFQSEPLDYSDSYIYVLQGRGFYYTLLYWLVLGIVTARQLARDAEEEAAEAARLEREALAADLQAARMHFDPRGLAQELREAAKLSEADPRAAEDHILETAGELQRSLSATAALAQRRVLGVAG